MNTQNIYKQSDNCLLEDMDGEMLLYNPSNATTLHMNGPSGVVWNLCNGEMSVQQICKLLQEAFPDQVEQINSDVEDVISDLAEREFLTLVET